MCSFLIATGADAGYFNLLRELMASIKDQARAPPVALGVINGGLTPTQLRSLSDSGAKVVAAPDFETVGRAIRARPALAVNLGKLWLDRLFPGYDTIVWLDADTWVQDWAAIELLTGAAQAGALAIVPGSGRAWELQTEMRWVLGGFLGGLGQLRSFNFKNARHAGLPLSICRHIGVRALLNAGVFALRANAPHWEMMRRWQARILRHGKPFSSDQLAMACAAYVDGLAYELLPAWCNYVAPRRVDPVRAELVEQYYPYRRVGVVHLSAQRTMRQDARATVPVLGTDGRSYQLNLRYGIFQRMMREAPGVWPEGALAG
jgi:hypothetical protein